MAQKNAGILTNASPLTSEQIKLVEERVLSEDASIAYLDTEGQLCFALPDGGVDGIKELAWNNCYELTVEGETLTKKQYNKLSINTYRHSSTYTKQASDDLWQETVHVSGPPSNAPDATPFLSFGDYDSLTTGEYADVSYGIYGCTSGALPNTLVIPETHENNIVEIIDSSALANQTTITDLWLPNGLRKILNGAFFGCTNLVSVHFGTGLTKIDRQAFQGCTALENITYAGTITEWLAVSKGANWNYQVPATYVQCADGRVDKYGNTVAEASN